MNLKYIGTTMLAKELIAIGLANETFPISGGWNMLANGTPVAVGEWITLTHNLSTQAEKNKYLVINENHTLNLSFNAWTSGSSQTTLRSNYYEVIVNYELFE